MPEHPDAIADEFLLVRCQLGERDALAQLIERFDKRLQAYLARMIGSINEDVHQEIWLSILRGLARLKRADRLDAWVFTIARRAVMTHLRRRYRRHARMRALPEDIPAYMPTTIPIDIDTALSALPLDEREAVTLFYLLGQSGKVVAEIQGIPEATVRSRLARARRRMTEHLAAEERGE